MVPVLPLHQSPCGPESSALGSGSSTPRPLGNQPGEPGKRSGVSPRGSTPLEEFTGALLPGVALESSATSPSATSIAVIIVHAAQSPVIPSTTHSTFEFFTCPN